MQVDQGAFELCRGCGEPLFRKLGRVNGVATTEPAAELLVLGGDTFFQCPRCWGRNHVARQGKGLTISGFTPSLLLTNRLAHDKRSA